MNLYHLGLALLMLVTGSINTLSVKWADTMTAESTDGQQRGFNHPFLQACGMFLGEMMCMVAFKLVLWRRRRQQGETQLQQQSTFSPLIFWPPALCDMTATSIQYIGLTLTYASSFQMLRGAVIVFTGLFSRLALGRRLGKVKWVGIFFVIVGLILVGVCDMIYQHKKVEVAGKEVGEGTSPPLFHAEYLSHIIRGGDDASDKNQTNSNVFLGDTLIVCAQLIVATQMVYEEKFISKYNVPPLQAVGWEGTFGFLTLSALLVPMYFIPVGPQFGHNPRHVLEDAYDGLFQLAHNPLLLTAFCGTVVSIAFFNFAGISVTKEMSATTRMVLDSVRTLVIWGVSLAVGWQPFYGLQLLGFAVLVFGMCIYNNIVIVPGIMYLRQRFFASTYGELNEDREEEATFSQQNESGEGNREDEPSLRSQDNTANA